MFLSTSFSKKQLILALYDLKISPDEPHSFIVPSKINKATFQALIKKDLISFEYQSLKELYEAIEKEDPCRMQKEQRIDTTTFLMRIFCPNVKSRKLEGNQGFDISNIIASYIGFSPLSKAVKDEVNKRCQKIEEEETNSINPTPL